MDARAPDSPWSPDDVALVAGGVGGVGRAVALHLVEAGFRVALLGRRAEPLQKAVARLPGSQLAVRADVTDRGEVRRAIAETTETWGPPVVLINAVGVAPSGPLLPADDQTWTSTLAINVTGAWHLATEVLPGMKTTGRGFIGHVASTAALQGYAYVAAYVASKHALLGLSRALVEDLRKTPVRVGTVCPGFLDTPMTARSIENLQTKTGMSEAEAREALAKMNPSGRLITPDEVAGALMDMLGDTSAHGHEIRID